MKNRLFILLIVLLMMPCLRVCAADYTLQSGKKINGSYVGGEDYNYYQIKASSSDYIAITVKTSDSKALLFDICDANKNVIASEINVPNKGKVYHKAKKGNTYYIRVKGTEGVIYTISYKMKSIGEMKYAKKYNYLFTNASFMDENNAVLVKMKASYAGIMQLMFKSDREVNVLFLDKNKKKKLSDIRTVSEHAFAGIGVLTNKTVYAKIWNTEGTNIGVTSIDGLKYQIKSVGTNNGSTKGKARKLIKGRYQETLVTAGKTAVSWYKVNVNKKQKVSFTVESRMLQNNGKNLELYICNSNGKKINKSPIVIDGETTVIFKKKYKMEYPVKTFGTTAQFPKGTYYLKVESKTKTSSGAYRIKWE